MLFNVIIFAFLSAKLYTVLPKKKKIVTCLLLALFVFHYANISFFYHTHQVNGFLISHSHLHSSDHAKTGTHTASELSLISVLSNLQSLKAAMSFVGFGLFLICLTIFRPEAENNLISTTPGHSYLRGPPVLC